MKLNSHPDETCLQFYILGKYSMFMFAIKNQEELVKDPEQEQELLHNKGS